MTRIVIRENHKAMTLELCARGHAGYADTGQDIVCASISILTQTFVQVALNLRELGANVTYQISDGAVGVEIEATSHELFEYVSCALQVVEVGCRLIAARYPDYIEITSKRLLHREDA